jgi:hypothetical protein
VVFYDLCLNTANLPLPGIQTLRIVIQVTEISKKIQFFQAQFVKCIGSPMTAVLCSLH